MDDALVGMAVTGQTITKNTSVSIALVVMLVGATIWATSAFTSTENRLMNVENDIKEIKDQQSLILQSIQARPANVLK